MSCDDVSYVSSLSCITVYPLSPYSYQSASLIWSCDTVFSNPKNQLDGFNLSYKDSETSILTEYFTCNPMLDSNYVNVDVDMSPSEYKDIKNGSFVHFDSDLYVVSEMEGYDPSGIEKTSLKIIKKK